MRIHFSNVNFSSNTGPNSFGSRLAQELTIQGHDIVEADKPYDAFLIFIEPSSNPYPGARVVQRLDGIWFKPEEFHTHNKMIKWAYDNSDFVVWQTEFDKKMTTKHWGERKGKVIHNGIDLNEYAVTDKSLHEIRRDYDKVFVCSSNWHRQKRLKENTELFFEIKKKHPNACLIVMGNSPDFTVEHKDVFYTGAIPHDLCLEVFAMADWMIHLAWLDHCPNVVVESISQKCPVICSSSGGTQEIVKGNGLVLPENKIYNFELLDYDKPYELSVVPLELPNIQVDNSYLDIKQVAQKYIRVLEKTTP